MDLKDFYDVEGKVVVITGGAGVLCSEMARCLGELGAKVAVLDIAEEALEELSSEFKEKEIDHIAVKTNVLDKASLEKARDKVISSYGRVDILINGAGGNKAEATTGPDKSFFDLPEESVNWVFDLNFMGTFLTCQVFGRLFAEQDEGVILNVSSMSAIAPLTKVSAYSAAKAAISNFTQWLAVHMSQNHSTKIRVNAIAPGFLLTNQNRYLLTTEDGGLTERGQTVIDHTPIGRFGDPKELLAAVLWLVTPGASFMHGAIVPIDGGFSAQSI